MEKGFLKLDEEKRNNIIQASLKEFAEHAFEQASTNRIVQEAGISKGMLFYYFPSKEDLFGYLIEYATDYVYREYLEQLDEGDRDFISRYAQAARKKMTAHIKNPHVFHFLATVLLNSDQAINRDYAEEIHRFRQLGFEKLYTNIDMSLFRKDIDSEMIFKLLHWIMEGYQQELMDSLQGKNLYAIDLEPYWQDFFSFLDLLKKLFYSAEEDDTADDH